MQQVIACHDPAHESCASFQLAIAYCVTGHMYVELLWNPESPLHQDETDKLVHAVGRKMAELRRTAMVRIVN